MHNLGRHHIFKRKIKKKRESHTWKTLLDELMYPLGLLGPVMLIPQILKIYIEKDASSIALSSWVFLVVPAILWATYGFSHKAKVIIVCNIAWVIAYSLVIIGAIIY